MKYTFILLLILSNISFTFSQNITIHLQDTLIANSSTWIYLHRYANFELEDSIAYQHLEKYTVGFSSFFSDNLFANKKYQPINYIVYQKNKKTLIKFDKQNTCDFKTSEIYEIGDTLNLEFFEEGAINSMALPVLLEKETRGIRFTLTNFYKANFKIKKEQFFMTLWPYRCGVKINVDTSFNFSKGKLEQYYYLDEAFHINNKNYYFSDYDYNAKTIKLKEKPYTEKLFGYKKGQYLNPKLQRELNVINNKYTIVYFGGKWCPPCLKKLPQLKKLAKFVEKQDVGIVSYMAQMHATKAEIYAYAKANNIPGEIKIAHMEDQNTIINDLDIGHYPGYLVFDQTGKMLFRDDNEKQTIGEFMFYLLKGN